MNNIPAKTGVPNLLNVNFTNTVDFHIAATNMKIVVEKYINFLTLQKYYNSLKYENDPITAEVEFWEGIAKGNLNLQQFAKQPKATIYIKRIEAKLAPNQTFKLDSGGNPIVYIDSLGNLVAETNDGTIPLTKEDTEVDEKLQNITTAFDLGSDRSGEFIAWWLEKYRRCHHKIKEELKKKMNLEDTILQEISESVGILFNQYLYPTSRDQHYADEDGDPTPYPYGVVIDDRLTLDTKITIQELSKRTDAIFKRNMRQVINTEATSDISHGENLVTDHLHNSRLAENQNTISENIINTLGGTYNVLSWLCMNQMSNKQKIAPGVYKLVIENSKEEVDILLNKIQTIKNRPFTMAALS